MEKVLKIFCDGGARGNPGPAAIGFVVKDNQGRTLTKVGRYIGKTTNNVAEYQAVIEALKWAKKNFLPTQIHFFLDSQLLVNQLNGRWRVKDRKLQRLIILVKKLERDFPKIFYHYIPRQKNKEADWLVKRFTSCLSPRELDKMKMQ